MASHSCLSCEYPVLGFLDLHLVFEYLFPDSFIEFSDILNETRRVSSFIHHHLEGFWLHGEFVVVDLSVILYFRLEGQEPFVKIISCLLVSVFLA